MEKPGYTFYEANCAYDRKKFLELDGFDDIYFPSTWEDADLCYRAWKHGWVVIYEPKSLIYHYESFTMIQEVQNNNRMFQKRRSNNRRNSFIFTWLNISDPAMLMIHMVLLPFNLLKALLHDRSRVSGFFQAIRYLPKIVRKRKSIRQINRLSDKTIFILAEKQDK